MSLQFLRSQSTTARLIFDPSFGWDVVARSLSVVVVDQPPACQNSFHRHRYRDQVDLGSAIGGAFITGIKSFRPSVVEGGDLEGQGTYRLINEGERRATCDPATCDHNRISIDK